MKQQNKQMSKEELKLHLLYGIFEQVTLTNSILVDLNLDELCDAKSYAKMVDLATRRQEMLIEQMEGLQK